MQFDVRERLGEIIVRPGLKPDGDIFFPRLGHQEDNVSRSGARRPARSPAHFDAVDARHHPIEDGERRRVRALEHGQRRKAVSGDDHLMPPFDECGFEHAAGDHIIFCDQDPH